MPKAKTVNNTKTTQKENKVTTATVSKPKQAAPKVKKTKVDEFENKIASSSPLSGNFKLPDFKNLNATQLKSNLQKYQNRKTYAILIILGLALLAFYFKSWFVAATVNGSPISNFEVISQMNKQYREQTLTQLINEKLILSEARKQGLRITPSEVDEKLAEIEKNVGGPEVLQTLLSQQGQTRESVKDQLKLQLTIEKLYAKDATVSADEVQKFVEQNKDQLRATEAAAQTKEAEDAIKQQKLSQIFNDKFTQLKKDAKITIF